MATLDLQGITKRFGQTEVLHDINLSIRDKEFVVFVGPSGCGKTTLLRIIAGLEEATTGAIMIDGRDVSLEHPIDRGISMVFQSYALYPHLTVFENIAFPLRVARLKDADLNERVHRAAEILQLTERLTHKPGQLSGGQRQRVAIGRSIVRDPKIFLFDEPLSNLDAALRGDMRVELSKLHKELAATMVYVTHDQIEAMTMADRIVVLSDGYVEQFGTPMDLYHHPKSRFVAGFIGHPRMNFVHATIAAVGPNDVTVRFGGGSEMILPVEPGNAGVGDVVEVGIRPEDVDIARGESALHLNVEVAERLGGTTICYGAVGSTMEFCAAFDGTADVREAVSVPLHIAPETCHLFGADGMAFRRLQAPAIAA